MGQSRRMSLPPLILASTSRYRRELLERLRLPFEALPPHVDETPRPGETPEALARRLALAKAMAAGESWGHATRKFAIDRANWPGWATLAGPC